MATSSILGGTKLPEEISGKDLHSLGPSDNSDSGSDAIGAYGDDELSSDSDAAGTGERASAGIGGGQLDADILPDHLENAPGADTDLDSDAGDDFNDLDEVDELAGDSDDEVAGDDPDAEPVDDDAAPGAPSAS